MGGRIKGGKERERERERETEEEISRVSEGEREERRHEHKRMNKTQDYDWSDAAMGSVVWTAANVPEDLNGICSPTVAPGERHSNGELGMVHGRLHSRRLNTSCYTAVRQMGKEPMYEGTRVRCHAPHPWVPQLLPCE